MLQKAPLRKSMLLSMLCKPIGMLISLFYTPILLNYLGEESYGIWSTILSVINWINYFDIGIGQGLRNVLASSVAVEDKSKSQKAVSTGYITLSIISIVVFVVGFFIIMFSNVSRILNTTIPIRSVLMVSFLFICINFVMSLSKTMLYATQQAEKVGFMTVLMQGINLIGILILSKFSSGNLFAVACVIGFSGVFVNVFFTKKIWNNYSYLVPHLSQFHVSELKEICNIGVKFFLVQIVALVLYSTDNILIVRMFGPTQVTPYSTCYTMFGVVNGLFSAMISPLWSQYTVAMEKRDYKWIKKNICNLDKMLIPFSFLLLILVFVFEPISCVWLHKSLVYPKGLILYMGMYYFLSIWGSIYANVLNGMSKINMQLSLGCVVAVLNIPLSVFLGKNCKMGSAGVCLATVICMLISNIPITISTHRFLNKLVK